MDEQIKQLKELIEVSSGEGVWNATPYQHGMANGLILALSLFTEEKPEYLDMKGELYAEKDAGSVKVKEVHDALKS